LDSSSQTFLHTLKEMQKQSDAMTLQATATQSAVAISKANLEQARTAFLASVEHAHLDQRAWVGAYQINVDGSISEDAKTYSLRGVNVVLRNGGKTPAINVLVNLQIATSLNINIPDIPDPFRNHLMSANTIPPGGEYVQYNTMTVLLKGDDPQNKGTLFISGEIRYNDIFDGTPQHVTKYCVERVSGNNFTFCGENNSNSMN